MKHAHYALGESQLNDAVVSYETDIGVLSGLSVFSDKDGPLVEGPDMEVDALINRIKDDLGVEPVHVSN